MPVAFVSSLALAFPSAILREVSHHPASTPFAPHPHLSQSFSSGSLPPTRACSVSLVPYDTTFALRISYVSPVSTRTDLQQSRHLPKVWDLCIFSKCGHHGFPLLFPLHDRQSHLTHVFHWLLVHAVTLHPKQSSKCSSAVVLMELSPYPVPSRSSRSTTPPSSYCESRGYHVGVS